MSVDLFDVKGKIALVTGSTHGLGMAMAKGLGLAGATIVVNGNSSQDKIDSAIAEYEKEGIKAVGYKFNVAKEDEVQAAVSKIEAEVGPIDILINNAGIIKRTPLLEMEVADFKEVVDIDLVSPFIVSKHVVKNMVERKAGKVINICSMMSELGRNSVGAYAAAKGGLKMLTQNMATEWAKYNIQVNGIGPGYFATSQTAPIRVDGHPFNDFIINRTPAAKWGDPNDLAGAAIFLSSKASDFVNGHVVYVDGGILATIGKPSNEE
ncbi:2-deoxy-D-gluconate 3-dehydrogenase 5) [Formosa agariphila KMM 3901]|uniref:2-dehydro-3-deoxy-D-gluconate 5-dehydrogenase n=1 Tax=Formosa agariphila (strain DSM 15362 / KCTC 12365 / LMG 23005 / KMM 3901 / M-2Alg 35-1) TaxID=1347342 RepID=PLH6_FORAG|nr:gluconate 5-dehydrogenase [Formosa agariphila]T2KLZ8.1 RecName: Full=2-dehydro-3-deoxy-D-gluconate 5-dehydrogenase; AltName: Full=2-deoxy-D-gluconate 3-dehydrogenase; AltName: Full=2-keto-3-deoxygluconate 5-dehydrogenase; AltName: Full=2-keto-3-deoxygluconate oxidoreductase; Short=KDG oxidoreductase; AltName: Full=P6_dehydrogenase; AltName: Full=Polysaccharide utilization locus H protein P6; Short=PUL H protein P6 [Formosa agariphila KMM 3901]CDF79907.1 2-deoxy-D-gluconate 3-dehydrogenase 5) [